MKMGSNVCERNITVEQWIEALESGRYEHGTGQLWNSSGGHCCLGVLAKEAGAKTFRGDELGLSRLVPFGFPGGAYSKLIEANDDSSSGFAPVIEILKGASRADLEEIPFIDTDGMEE